MLPTPLFVRTTPAGHWHACVTMPNGAVATRTFAVEEQTFDAVECGHGDTEETGVAGLVYCRYCYSEVRPARWTWALVWTDTNRVFADGFADLADAIAWGRSAAGNRTAWAVRRILS